MEKSGKDAATLAIDIARYFLVITKDWIGFSSSSLTICKKTAIISLSITRVLLVDRLLVNSFQSYCTVQFANRFRWRSNQKRNTPFLMEFKLLVRLCFWLTHKRTFVTIDWLKTQLSRLALFWLRLGSVISVICPLSFNF